MALTKQFFTDKLMEIPQDVLEGAIKHLENLFDADIKQEIRSAFAQDGVDWISEYHHGWGTAIRNELRQAGFKDEVLPDKNWDDYYSPILEIAVGIRLNNRDQKYPIDPDRFPPKVDVGKRFS